MTHIVTRLCLRDTACVDVCPVECMILGKPEDEWPWLYIDPDTLSAVAKSVDWSCQILFKDNAEAYLARLQPL